MYENASVPGITYFSPMHTTSPGTAKDLSENIPTLFHPLKIRGITLRNRICVSPMCQYSCAPTGPQTGVLTPLYFTTIGHYAFKGAALVMLEATGVCPAGRISVNCPGLYNDTQRDGLKPIVDFVHAQSGLIGVQLSHAGRKSSTQARGWLFARARQVLEQRLFMEAGVRTSSDPAGDRKFLGTARETTIRLVDFGHPEK